MRKILILTLFFVILLPLLPRFGCTTVHAQGIANENYYICFVNGYVQSSLYPCSDGHEAELIKCTKCGEQYMSYESHDCKEEKIWCAFCDQLLTPEEYANHNCSGDGDNNEPDGGDSSGGGGSGGGGSSGGSSGGESSGGEPNNDNDPDIGQIPDYEDIYFSINGKKYVDFQKCKRFTVSQLKADPNITLVKYNLQDKFPKQVSLTECVACAIGNMTNINFGASYQNAKNIVSEAASETEKNYRAKGITLSKIPKVVRAYGTLIKDLYSEDNIANAIENHQAVLGVVETPKGGHAVTIIGYDRNYYYCIDGWKEDPVQLPKKKFIRYIYTLTDKISVFKCKRL